MVESFGLGLAGFSGFRVCRLQVFQRRGIGEGGTADQALRQSIYWRALRTIPSLEIIEGHFKVRKTWARSANPPPDMVEIIRAEEKGSDVNLASHLLVDAMAGSYDVALVISGDSDLVTPIGMLTRKFVRPVGVINPQRLSGPDRRRLRGSSQLKQVASYYRGGLTWAQLERAQLTAMLTDSRGDFGIPPEWRSISDHVS